MSISAELRAEAAKQNLTYADIAAQIGISRQAVSAKLRNDESSFKDTELRAYARVLDTHAWELMRRAEASEAKS